MSKYYPSKIEKKWQKVWEKEKIYIAKDKTTKGKKYVLIEFPYPSGEGLHMGHLRPYVAGDLYSRYMRMKGFETMYPIGWDAFGLPAENFAIKKGIHPSITTANNIKNAKRQIQNWGIGFDWSREINTTDPEYYKWTQWIFLQLFKAGLAYEATGEINWCPSCKTGLANEEVVDGRCERCGTKVEKKELRQWYLKITAYAEKLLAGLKNLDWPEQIKIQQENWIGKSEGALIKFKVKSLKLKVADIEVFTTRADTLYGATYIILAPEHEIISKLKNQNAKLSSRSPEGRQFKIQNWEEVEEYIKKTKNKSEAQRTDTTKEKTGVELKGIKAINPATGQEISVWIADYVLADYGTGAIMAVPAHDHRDYEFAEKFDLPIREVIVPNIIDERNPPVSGKKVVERRNVHAIVRDPKTGEYLALKWKKFDWTTFPMGGVKDGEDVVTAAKREVEEETGFVNLKLVKVISGQVRAEYFAAHKDQNRVAFTTAVVFDLVDHKQVQISQEEKNDHDIMWLERSKLNYKNMTHAEVGYWDERMESSSRAYAGEGVLINSGKFDGMDSERVKGEIIKFVDGKKKVQYKLRDWVFSRQRYWGEPIPLIHCEKCGVVAVPEKDLPVKLPKVEKYEPTGTGESPLAVMDKWVKVKCPSCGGPGKRETNTMPQWAGSSWYYLRYTDPKNKKELADRKLMEHWLPVDVYFGGLEHTTLHLLYSRFWHQFLYDQKIVPTPEPYARRVPHGIILAVDGDKMSKSRGNVVNPDDIVKEYGADVLRMYELFLGPHEATVSWNDQGIMGVKRFLDRVWKLANETVKNKSEGTNLEIEKHLHRGIKKVGEDIENYKFNTAVSSLMILSNSLGDEVLTTEQLETFIELLAPFAPHLTEEIWRTVLKNKKSIHFQLWPTYDPAQVVEEKIKLIVQVNGKVREVLEVERDLPENKAKELVLASEKIKKYLDGKPIQKFIYLPNRLVNVVV